MAIDYLTENSFKYITATGRCEGNNLIKAGSVLEIKEIGERFQRKYLATSVKHRFVTGVGYETEFFLNRNTVVGKKGGGSSSGTASAMASSNQNEEQEEQGVLMPEFSNLAWKTEDESVTEAIFNTVIFITADVNHMRNGQVVNVIIWEKDKNNPGDAYKELRGNVKDGTISVRWKYQYPQEEGDIKEYKNPEFYFKIAENRYNVISDKSPNLRFKDTICLQFVYEETNEPLANSEYILILPDDTMKEGSLDSDGYLNEDDVPPGKYQVILNDPQFIIE